MGLLAFAFAFAFASEASAAEPETASLDYHLAADVEGCPDEDAFRNKVAARLGYQPFASGGRHHVVLDVARRGTALVGRAQVKRAGGASARPRELTGVTGACDALVDALATTVAIAIDPMSASAPPPAPLPELPAPPVVAPPAETPRSEPPIVPPPPSEKPGARVRMFATFGGVASTGAAPGAALGAEAGVGARLGVAALELFARVETMPSPVRVDSGDRLEATLLSATIAPCAHVAFLFGCVFGRVGALQGRAPDVVEPSLGTSAFGAVGLRAGPSIQLTPWLALRGVVEAALPLVRTSLIIGGSSVWTASPFFGGGALSAVIVFP